MYCPAVYRSMRAVAMYAVPISAISVRIATTTTNIEARGRRRARSRACRTQRPITFLAFVMDNLSRLSLLSLSNPTPPLTRSPPHLACPERSRRITLRSLFRHRINELVCLPIRQPPRRVVDLHRDADERGTDG